MKEEWVLKKCRSKIKKDRFNSGDCRRRNRDRFYEEDDRKKEKK